MNTEPAPLINSQSLSKPSVYQTPMETNTNVFLQAPMPFTPLDVLPTTQSTNLNTLVPPVLGKCKNKK